jgi:hypothetical protein
LISFVPPLRYVRYAIGVYDILSHMVIERSKKKSGVVTAKASICRTRLQPWRFFSLDRTCLNIFTAHVALAYVLTVGSLLRFQLIMADGRRNTELGTRDWSSPPDLLLLRSRVATFTYR